MDGFVTIDRQRRLDIQVDQPWPGLPQVGRLSWQCAEQGHCVAPLGWKDDVAVVQVSLAGSGWIKSKGERVKLPAGHLLVFNSKEHRLTYGFDRTIATSWEYCWADMTGEPALAAIRELVRHRGSVFPGGALVAAAIQSHLPAFGVRQAAWTSTRAAQVAWEILAAVFSEQQADSASPLAVQAMAWFDAHIALPAGVSAAAAALGVTREHLTRIFRLEVGLPPGAWLRHRRIERAELMLASGLDVGDVAARVGFASRSHFAIAYRNQRGTNPRR